MARPAHRIDITTATFVRALAAAALVWVWLTLWPWLLVLIVAVFLAIALEPGVRWLEARRVRRTYAAPLIVLLLVAVVAGLLALSGASLVSQASLVTTELTRMRQLLVDRVPPRLLEAVSSSEQIRGLFASVPSAAVGGAAGMAFALIATVYLLIEGGRTYRWLATFFPARLRPKVHRTAVESRQMVAAYVRGNLITSALTAVVTWIVLTALGVPAALLLALLAGLFDLVPVIGFVLSAIPAVLLGLTVSPTVGIAVGGFYILYNAVENYYIQPKVYGNQLRLSDLAVIGAFLVGAELGGVLGAIIALPVAAIYPIVERIWLKDSARSDIPEEHARIAESGSTDET
jgi:predicted PurR-regulated permease PerM